MKKQSIFVSLFILSLIFNLSCKGPQGEVGPAGPAGETGDSYDPNQNYIYKEGFAKATVTGERLDGTDYSYNFDFQGNWDATDNNFEVYSATETKISISKNYSGEGDALLWGSIRMDFTVTSLSDLSSPIANNFSVQWSKDLGSNKFHETDYYYYLGSSNGATVNVSNLVYNSATNVLTGNYTFAIPGNEEKGSNSITNGTFSTKLSNVVARMSAK